MAKLANKRKNQPRKDETRQRHGMLVGIRRDGNAGPHWWWQCDCGATVLLDARNVRSGNTSSCGCLRAAKSAERMTKHGLCGKSLAYEAWERIRKRCAAKSGTGYRDYASKGIRMCDEWLRDPAAFVEHVGEPRSPDMTIDRIDNARGYEPGNVRWATVIEQANNKTNNRIVEYKGQKMTLSQMIRARAADEGIKESIIRSWVERALYHGVGPLSSEICQVVDGKAWFRGEVVAQ